MDKLIFHVDVNSAYLSWEAIDMLSKGADIDIRTIPCIVGGDIKKRKGVILAKSTPCKKYNIQSGEPIYSAMKKCPTLKSVPPHFDIYIKYSKAMNEILKLYSDKVEKYSIDESFLDVTHLKNSYSSPTILGDDIRNRIYKELGFTVNVGISSNKLLAKMATDLRKPNFTTTLFPEEIEKMWHLPVGDLFMVGKKTSIKLNQIGIYTIGQLAKYNKKHLELIFKSHGKLIHDFANGIDDSEVNIERGIEKGVGNSSTIAYDVSSYEDAYMHLLSLCEMVAMRLRKKDLEASVICVHIRNSDFINYSHQMKIPFSTNNTTDIYKYCKKLFDSVWKKDPIRHLGVRATDLSKRNTGQLSIFDVMDDKKEKLYELDKTIDKLRDKYGKSVVFRASFSNTDKKPIKDGNN